MYISLVVLGMREEFTEVFNRWVRSGQNAVIILQSNYITSQTQQHYKHMHNQYFSGETVLKS